MIDQSLKTFLDTKVDQYNQPFFITDDPVSIPHRFSKKQDIEIAGFFTAILSWGNRKSIINSATHLFELMDDAPYDYIMNTKGIDDPGEFGLFENFVHRTFNGMDLSHLLKFMKYHYGSLGEPSLETAFTKCMTPGDATIENALAGFHNYVFGFDKEATEEKHCRKHIATPAKKSACKKLNMFLRWMVRNDNKGVDFGIWTTIRPAQLICPLDVHVSRIARKLGLLHRKQNDWQAASELTGELRQLDHNDPVKYDFALFALGVLEKY